MNKVRCLAIYFLLISLLVWGWFFVMSYKPAIKRTEQVVEVVMTFDEWVDTITSMEVLGEGGE